MIPVHALLTENAIAEDFVSSLRSRRLAEKFFYWFPLSVRAWLALCSDGAYRNFVRSRSLIARSANELGRLVQSGFLEVVSLGSGQGDKDLLLLEAFVAQGTHVRYTPVDASQALVEMACGRALEAGVWSQAIKADITNADHLAALAAEDEDAPPRLVLLLGNTLGAFDPVAEAHTLRALLRPEDLLIVDGEIYAGHQTVAGYDNPLNRRFAWAPLESVGIGERDGEIVFEDVTDGRPGLHPLRKHFRADREVSARVGGETLTIRAGERVEMNHSYKYEADAFLRILDAAGLDVQWRGTSEDERFQMVLAAPK